MKRLLVLVIILLIGCSSAVGKNENRATQPGKGEVKPMKTYRMGRFFIDVPEDFKLAVQSHRFRLVEIEEFPEVLDPVAKWKDHLEMVNKRQKPPGVEKIVIRTMKVDGVGKWAMGVLYYGDPMAADECNWDILACYGSVTVLFSLNGIVDKEQSMLSWLTEVVRAYSPYVGKLKEDSFYTEYGVIDLPYKRQENTYARLEGATGMKLEIDMNETHQVEDAGVFDRLVASLVTNFAPGVAVDKIRAGKRTVAGFAGQEIIVRMADKNGKELFFAWDYGGKENSGSHPEVKIGMVGPDGNLAERQRAWEKILESFRAAPK